MRAHDLSFSPEVFGFLRLNVWNMKQSYAIFAYVCVYTDLFLVQLDSFLALH